jgi:LuxR family transcriptional regulator, maltose regulon positive regulatory protein
VTLLVQISAVLVRDRAIEDGCMTSTGSTTRAAAAAEPGSQPPVHRPGLVLRTALLERLADVRDDVPLVLLTAPAGYGKTTVLSQWAAADDRRFSWVTVEEADGDPVRLARQIAVALHQLEPLDPTVFRALDAGDGSRHVVALPHLLRSLRQWSAPGVLVLDDVHELRNVESMNFIRALAAGLPRRFHIAVGSRLVFGLGRLRSEDRCVEIGSDHLVFSEEEARAVLAGADVNCSDEVVRALIRRTEGWPAGIYLAALAIRDSPDAAKAVSGLAGDDPFIVDYIRDELLARESPETVRFLLRTVPLKTMCGSLCDDVLGRSGSAGRLAEAARRNLFVVPLDRRGEWYRYHRLVSETLLSELRRREPGEELRVHAHAARWYEERGEAEDAIGHALAGRDTLTAARLVNRHAREFVAAGRMHTVRGWFDSLGPDGFADYPPLAVTAAWIWALRGDPLQAQRCLHEAGRGTFDGVLPDGSTSLTSAITVLRATMGSLGVDRMVLDATVAVGLEAPGSPWHPAAVGTLGIAHALTGASALAVKELEHAVRLGWDGQRPAAVACLGELSLLAAEQQNWARAAEKADEAIGLIATAAIEEHLFSILGYAAKARVAAHRGDRAAARRHVGMALRLYASPTPAAFPWLSAEVAITLGHTFLDLGDIAAARFRAQEAGEHLARLLSEGVLRARLDVLRAAIGRAGGQAPDPSAMALSTAEMRVLQLLPTHLSLGEIGDELHTSRNTIKSHVAAVYRKLHCSTRTEAVRRGRDLGLLAS